MISCTSWLVYEWLVINVWLSVNVNESSFLWFLTVNKPVTQPQTVLLVDLENHRISLSTTFWRNQGPIFFEKEMMQYCAMYWKKVIKFLKLQKTLSHVLSKSMLFSLCHVLCEESISRFQNRNMSLGPRTSVCMITVWNLELKS